MEVERKTKEARLIKSEKARAKRKLQKEVKNDKQKRGYSK